MTDSISSADAPVPPGPTDDEIAAEAYRIWEAAGRPIWSSSYDHWLQAIENLKAGKREPTGEIPQG